MTKSSVFAAWNMTTRGPAVTLVASTHSKHVLALLFDLHNENLRTNALLREVQRYLLMCRSLSTSNPGCSALRAKMINLTRILPLLLIHQCHERNEMVIISKTTVAFGCSTLNPTLAMKGRFHTTKFYSTIGTILPPVAFVHLSNGGKG